ncbi:hypothetical protein MAM1_0107c05459 [Mucor ambiguus]|uniref:PROP1-like PPR domain-containing protein n=1 Tax=Mucor ambiguus TaxID=91626 RepID=A0A0C9MV27_9FUNG|nr:hypothetical protein MAM1_0107c05459 [Mucor ambiguus]
MLRKTTISLWPIIARSIQRTKPARHGINMTHHKPHGFFYSTESAAVATQTTSFTAAEAAAAAAESAPKKLPWERYRELVASNSTDQITAADLQQLSKFTVVSKGVKPSEAIVRLQDILKYMSTRKETEPDFKAAFPQCCNFLIRAYIRHGDMKTARLVFDKMAQVGDVNEGTLSEMLSGIRQLGTRAEAYEFQKSMERQGLWVDSSVVYTNLIYTLRDFGDTLGCRHYFQEMKSKNLATTEHAYKAIMSVYRKANLPHVVLKYFNEMKEAGIQPSIAVYGLLFQSFSHNDPQQHKAILQSIFQEMKGREFSIDLAFYLPLGWEPLDALQQMMHHKHPVKVRDCNVGLSHYIKNNQFSEALNVMKWMNEHKVKMDTYSYGIMIDALAKDPDTSPQLVFDLYEDMKRHKLHPDPVMFTSLISNCCKNQDLDKALSLLQEMISYELKPNTYTFNSILNVVTSMADTSSIDVERASVIWTHMTDLGVQPDTRTCNIYLSLIARLVKAAPIHRHEPAPLADERYIQTTTLWEEMEDTNRRVPQTVKEMQRMYRYMRRHKLESMHPDFLTYAIVISAMSTAGEVRSAMQVYDDAKINRVTLPIPAYNNMMLSLQRCGRVSESMGIWHDMKLQGVLPNSTTYSIVLENCEQLGLVDSIENIRRQRKLDFDRLQELERKREMRKLERSHSRRPQ